MGAPAVIPHQTPWIIPIPSAWRRSFQSGTSRKATMYSAAVAGAVTLEQLRQREMVLPPPLPPPWRNIHTRLQHAKVGVRNECSLVYQWHHRIS